MPKSKKETNPTKDIPKEVLDELPDSVKAELGMSDKPAAGPVFQKGDIQSINEAMRRLSDGFEKIGLTLIGRMGEFATTLERMMMTIARLEKVENLVSEMKYFNKGLQKTLDEIGRKMDRIDRLDVTHELEQFKKLLQSTPLPQAPSPAAPAKPAAKPEPAAKPKPAAKPEPAAKPKPVAKPKPAAKAQKAKPKQPTKKVRVVKSSVETTSKDEAALMDAISEFDADLGDLSLEDTASEAPASTATSVPETWFAQLDRIFDEKPATGKDLVIKVFDTLVLVKEGGTCKEFSQYLEKSKKFLSENYKWTPILYEMGKTARTYKNKKSSKITAEQVKELKSSIEAWKSKLLEVDSKK